MPSSPEPFRERAIGSPLNAANEPDPLAGLPPDLVRVLRDPSIIVPQDAAVFELIAKWMDAPSDTVSAWGVDEWRAAWVKEAQRANRYKAELEELRPPTAASTGVVPSPRELTMQDRLLVAAHIQTLANQDAALQVIADRVIECVRCCDYFPECAHVVDEAERIDDEEQRRRGA